ncbi:MAG: 3-hydroxyacyl-CoA dehydrogenase family protein [Cuniculiplasma sp.]
MKVSVIGSGTMGRGIGQIFAQNGYDVNQVDVNQTALNMAEKSILESLNKLYSKHAISESPEDILKRINFSDSMESVRRSDLVIEAVFEKLEIKTDTLSKISDTVDKDVIIGTNTSSISINFLSKYVRNPERFLGIHFFNPVPIMKLVEVVSSELTTEFYLKKASDLLVNVGKDPVFVKDFPGFVSNRVLMPLIREAILVFEENVANARDIDKTFRLGMNHPMGPLELADFIGLDVCQDIMEVLYVNYGDPRFKAPVTLRNFVNSGKLGRKSGEGFYKYEVKK